MCFDILEGQLTLLSAFLLSFFIMPKAPRPVTLLATFVSGQEMRTNNFHHLILIRVDRCQRHLVVEGRVPL